MEEQTKKSKDRTNPHYAEILAARNVTRLTTIEQIDAIFNISSLRREEPKIHTGRKALLMFDTADFNSAYVLDEFDKFMTIAPHFDRVAKAIQAAPGISPEDFETAKASIFEKVTRTIPETDAYYCDDEELHTALFAPFVEGRNMPKLNPPAILMVAPGPDVIFVDLEYLYPIDHQKILMAYLMLHDAHEAKGQMAAAAEERRKRVAENTEIN